MDTIKINNYDIMECMQIHGRLTALRSLMRIIQSNSCLKDEFNFDSERVDIITEEGKSLQNQLSEWWVNIGKKYNLPPSTHYKVNFEKRSLIKLN